MKPTHTLWLAAALVVACATAAEPLVVAVDKVDKDDTTISVQSSRHCTKNGPLSKPLFEYRYADVPFKPYVSQMRTPAGFEVLRDSPHDHKHHHGLMFALAADGVDFWSEKAQNGKQLSRSLDGPATVPGGARFTQRLDWVATNGTVVLREQRSIFVHDMQVLVTGPGDGLRKTAVIATLLTWRSRLSAGPNRETVKLTGAHYFGLGARFPQEMDQGGEFINSSGQAGETVRGDERLAAAKWCAYSAAAPGKPFGQDSKGATLIWIDSMTFAIFDDPKNPRHPARMFTMSKPFAYLSATLNLWKETMELNRGSELDLCYGVAVCNVRLGADKIEELYQRWLALRSASK
jgi:hypothetical protein